ncbi:hypothetical protein I4U23_012862 [Adineta vaga]|nr:hypothetical protein I4U23_012862 [Adineta vaga]
MSQWLSKQQNEFTPLEVTTTKDSLLTNEHLEKIIFERPNLDLDQWRHFLQTKLFSSVDDEQKFEHAFHRFKHETEKYSKILLTEKVSSHAVRRAISSLLNQTLLDEYRKRLLTKLQLDDNVVNEFASSLTLMISELTDWKWTTEGVRGIFRRNLAGKYRCYYEEDFLTAIFLEHIGLKWSYHFKKELKELFQILTKKARNKCATNSIQNERFTMQQNDYWMASLPDERNCESGLAAYEETSSLDLKTKLFHIINVEIQLHQVLRPTVPFTVVTTDLEWFGPSISHEIIQIFLESCGMPQIWLDFFDRFLKQSVYYKPGDVPRQRQRGVPISHSMSYLFSELLIFGMDLYVYRNTGIFNYRLHDDFWFFHYDTAKVEQAWLLMNEYVQLSGLKFNAEKCGSVQIQPSNNPNHTVQSTSSTVLPLKELKWRLLILQSSGRFIIDRPAVVPFLDEMKTRLISASTILEWVEIYNQYISFFMRNFGRFANVLGTYHIEQVVETFQFIHRYIFPETDGNILIILTKRIQEQFPSCSTDQLCEAWFYWPLVQGGLDLKHIYLTLYSYRDWLLSTVMTTFDQLPAKDVELYAELVEKYEQTVKPRGCNAIKEYIRQDGKLITFDEYVKNRENHHMHWFETYHEMLGITQMSEPIIAESFHDEIQNVLDGIEGITPRHRGRRNPGSNDCILWLACYYGEQIKSTFNQLDFIDSDNLPIGLITLMKSTKINWNKVT